MGPSDGMNEEVNKLTELVKNLEKKILQIPPQFAKSMNQSFDLLDPKNLGDLSEMMSNMADKLNTSMGSTRQFVDDIRKSTGIAVDELSKYGINAQDAVAKAAEMGKSFTETTGRQTRLAGETISQLETATRTTGIQSNEIIKNFFQAGISLEDTTKILGKGMDVARQMGANGQLATQKMNENLSAMDKFSFQGGIDGLAKMAAQATSMNVNMEKVLLKADELLDPEKAIETAAALQRLGVVQSDLLDPMRLMNMAQNDPAELQKNMVELSKEFVHMNEQGKIEILPGAREKMKLVAQQLGLSTDEMTKMAKSAFELDDKMKNMKFPDVATDEQKQMFANLAHLGKDGTYKINIDGQDVAFEEAMSKALEDPDYMKKLEDAGKPVTLEELAKQQLTLEQQQLAVMMKSAGVSAAVVSSKPNITLDEYMRNLMRGTEELARTALPYDKISKGYEKGTTSLLKGEFSEASTNYETMMPDMAQIVVKFKEVFPEFTSVIQEATKELKKILGQPDIEGNDFVINVGKKKIKLFEKDTIFGGTKGEDGGGGFGETFEKISGVMKKGAEKAGEEMGPFLEKAGEGIKKGVKNVGEVIKESAEKIPEIPKKGKKLLEDKGEFGKTENETPEIGTKSQSGYFGKSSEPKGNAGKTSEGIGGTITLNFNFTADANSAQFAGQIVDMFKNNTELQETVTQSIRTVASGYGTLENKVGNGPEKPSSSKNGMLSV